MKLLIEINAERCEYCPHLSLDGACQLFHIKKKPPFRGDEPTPINTDEDGWCIRCCACDDAEKKARSR
jgi:hypothetical protein